MELGILESDHGRYAELQLSLIASALSYSSSCANLYLYVWTPNWLLRKIRTESVMEDQEIGEECWYQNT